MKVKESKPDFKPINITIESEGELIILWAALNISGEDLVNAAAPYVELPEGHNTISHQMWDAVNDKLKQLNLKL